MLQYEDWSANSSKSVHNNKHERNHALLRSSASGIHAARYSVLRNEARCTARCDDRVSRCTLKRTNHTSLLGKLDRGTASLSLMWNYKLYNDTFIISTYHSLWHMLSSHQGIGSAGEMWKIFLVLVLFVRFPPLYMTAKWWKSIKTYDLIQWFTPHPFKKGMSSSAAVITIHSDIIVKKSIKIK